MGLRRQPRFPVQCPIAFNSGIRIVGEGTVRNLSKGGLKVNSTLSVTSGTYLMLHISLPHHESPIGVDLAVVRWLAEPEFGVEFIRIGAEARERLQHFVTTLEPSPNH